LLAPDVREFVGTDVSSKMIEIAQDKAADEGLNNLDFRVTTASDAAKLREPFDVVTGFNIFHLVQDAETIFADVHRMLPVGGYFISKTPCLADKSVGLKRFAFRAMIPVMQWIGKAPFVRFFTQTHLEDAIKFAGFEIVESGNFPAISRYVVAKRI
jgi:2-polyprenyl-3-methyl-5-hydroxy-6-metoxy-1,4-benzoquinol methylase